MRSNARDQIIAGDRRKDVRVLVITPDAARRDKLSQMLSGLVPPILAARFWLADESILSGELVDASRWVQVGSTAPKPLLNTGQIGSN